jgi:hypothetical protein
LFELHEFRTADLSFAILRLRRCHEDSMWDSNANGHRWFETWTGYVRFYHR